ncbi:MAG: hypothetical protein ABI203_06420 [Mucilaginibacter sp.]
MKKYLVLIFLLCGCVRSQQQYAADKAAEDYMRQMLGNPPGFETVSFSELLKKRYKTTLDSSLAASNSGIDSDDYSKMHKFIDSENAVMPGAAIQNLKDIDNMERGKLEYYTLVYTFRIDSDRTKITRRYKFELDSLNNVIKASDVTHWMH